jgi:hypothetical protein
MEPKDQVTRAEIGAVLESVRAVLAENDASGGLPELTTANALRIAIKNGPVRASKDLAVGPEKRAAQAKEGAGKVLNPAENAGGLMAFRYVAPVAIVLIAVFGGMYVRDRRARLAAAAAIAAASTAPPASPGQGGQG